MLELVVACRGTMQAMHFDCTSNLIWLDGVLRNGASRTEALSLALWIDIRAHDVCSWLR
jgi:hypothetical protein